MRQKRDVIATLLKGGRPDLARVVAGPFGIRDPDVDEIGKFWVVTRPRPTSEMVDILFETNVTGMMLQARGGLEPSDLAGVFKSKAKATDMAKRLIEERG